ncbi:MAG: endolytic transglycosylase MltG [Armatimonadota bacterium]
MKKRKNRDMKLLKQVIASTKKYIAALLILLVIIIWTLVLGSLPVDMRTEGKVVSVTIPRGTPARKVAEILQKEKVIRSKAVFMFTIKASGLSKFIKPGMYDINTSMNLPEIIRMIVEGRTVSTWITFPEGFTARQMGETLEKAEKMMSDDFTYTALDFNIQNQLPYFVFSNNLEGYLFPDTYLVSRSDSPEMLIQKMLRAFETKVIKNHKDELSKAIKEKFGYDEDRFAEGLYKILIVASMVERETRIADERPIVSAVIWNRLNKNMRLEIDATVTYIAGESKGNKNRVLYSDLKNQNPHNTYKIKGLPPTPISNPGLKSILASANPADVDYLYYVAKSDGSHIFSRTYNEHLNAIKKARSGQ